MGGRHYDEVVTAPIIPGCEPFSASNGPNGVLVLHGFTGNPQSMRPLAEAFADAGFSVELPLLPGHGTSIEDMLATRWADWSGAAERAYSELAARCDKVAVAGLSMGGTLTLMLAERHREIAGIVLVNPLVEKGANSFLDSLRQMLAEGIDRIPGIGSDIAKPNTVEAAYEGTPIAPLLSLMEGTGEVQAGLGSVCCPVLLLSSRQDHVVPTTSGDAVVAGVSGPVERVFLEASYHVATLDYDQAEIEERAVQFTLKAMGA